MNKRQRKKRAKSAGEVELLRQEIARLTEACADKDQRVEALAAAQAEEEQGRDRMIEEKDRMIQLLLADIEAHGSDYHHRTDPRLLAEARRVLEVQGES